MCNRDFENNLTHNNDTDLLKTYSDDYKIKLLDDLHKILDIEWFDKNLLNKLKKDKNLMRKVVIDNYIIDGLKDRKLFNCRAGEMPITYIDWITFLLKRYTMFSSKVIHCNVRNLSIMVNGNQKRISVPTIEPFVEMLQFIVNYETEIINIKQIYDKNHPKECHDEYMF